MVADEEVVSRLLAELERRTSRLEALRDAGPPPLSEQDRQDLIERNLQLAIQACIDLGAHILADENRGDATTYADVFVLLHQQGVLSEEIAEALAAAAGMRNILTHMYLEVDHRLVNEALDQLHVFRDFARTMAKHLGTS